MKQINKIVLMIALAIMSLSVYAQKKVIQFNELPKSAQSFVSTYYTVQQISIIVVDKEFMSTSYKVKLIDGVEIEFDNKGNWTEVDAEKKAVPNQIVNPKIMDYVKKSFPNNEIVQVSRERNKIEVELTNGLDLVFNKNGKFIRIDD